MQFRQNHGSRVQFSYASGDLNVVNGHSSARQRQSAKLLQPVPGRDFGGAVQF
jgi:hypothetical protein